MPHRFIGGLSLAAALAAPLSAQRASHLRIAPSTRIRAAGDTLPPARPQLRIEYGIAGGLVGGSLGGLAGAGVGILIAEAKQSRTNGCGGGDLCGLPEAVLSTIVGESIGLAIGSHYGARGRGSLTGEILASVGIGVAGTILGAYAGGWPILLVPVAQIATVLALEHP
jgi:hypothetical protein